MVLVMILIAVAVILGSSFLTSASIHVRISKNYQSLARARYLAESGLEHGFYILRFSPETLEGSVSSPLGPFHVDDSPDSYMISAWEDEATPRRYTLTSTATVGDVKRTSSMTVYRTAGPTIKSDHAILVDGAYVHLPICLRVEGDVHVNGQLNSRALINGDVSATNGITDPMGRINGSTDGDAEEINVPEISVNDYINYRISMTDYAAVGFAGIDLTIDNPLANGGAVTTDNIGGVVYLNPSDGDTVRLHDNFNFTGTLVIDGNIDLRGQNITLNAVDGFPAIVATGSVKVSRHARNVTINGLVSAQNGIRKSSNHIHRSRTTINGALVCKNLFYSFNFAGYHVLNYRQDRTEIYDFSQGPDGAKPQVTVLSWDD